jgi:hypothetical protein
MASPTTLVAFETCTSTTGTLMSFTPSIYSNVSSKYSFNEVFIITEIAIDRWSIYECRLLVMNKPHSDPIIIMGFIVLVITITIQLQLA